MAIRVSRPNCVSVFDAGFPAIDYLHAQSPDEPHEIMHEARRQAPIAIGPHEPHGPQILTYELVHRVLRDSRFRVPQGMFLAAQGITSGPLWDRVGMSIISMDGGEHRRLRCLVSKAFTPRGLPEAVFVARTRRVLTAEAYFDGDEIIPMSARRCTARFSRPNVPELK
jgi:cytochrome P450